MNDNPIRRSVTQIDPLFYIPDDVDELTYTENVEASDVDSEEEFDDSGEGIFYEEETEEDFEYIPVPVIAGVAEQIIRTTASGAQVVDLILNIDGLQDGSEAEFKVAKI